MTLSFFPAQTKISMRWDLSFTGIVALKWARIGGPTMASFQFILRANSGKRTRTIFHERELARHNAWLGTLLFRLLFNRLQCRLWAKPRILAIQNTHWAVHPYKQTGIRPTSVTWKGKWTREMSSFSWQLIKNVSRAAINPQISDRRIERRKTWRSLIKTRRVVVTERPIPFIYLSLSLFASGAIMGRLNRVEIRRL